ncbi:FIG00572419: hypothetical protein [uncultured Synechococcales cyanobacterium]|uniref:G domain-containing protein n=1 Tax=uncultured Synechococcales cyanobacterium TaxID=1936017 RepID=A0A6J4V592_9CYAN|nr:FIG00572419: hypothetical protein [uncultured Synechococcales cyanobacterium]
MPEESESPADSSSKDKAVEASSFPKSVPVSSVSRLFQRFRLKLAPGLLLKPWQQKIVSLTHWFRIDEAEISQVLEEVRLALPTTEVLLIGKPQTGKSSIIRGLTGISAEIVGQGFRPHTAHTQRYNYPTGELPLLVFTDTVGLGEGVGELAVIQELTGELQSQPSGVSTNAKVLVVTVKINDFATDALWQIVAQIRRRHPEVPCLLAVTCLHEIYPPEVTQHPVYPPSYPDLIRAFSEIKERFGKLCDSAVLIDFTLEEDGYTPVFYGLEHFVATLADLLPQAESQAIHQLLQESEAGFQIGQLYREAGRRYIAPFAIMAGTLAAVPLPLATMPVLTALQVTLVSLLGRVYGQVLTPSQAGGVASAIAGGFMAQLVGRELVKFIPGFGSVIAASWAAAYTWALGEGACVYFGDLMGGKQPDPQKIKKVMDQAFKDAQARFKDAVWSPPSRSAPD